MKRALVILFVFFVLFVHIYKIDTENRTIRVVVWCGIMDCYEKTFTVAEDARIKLPNNSGLGDFDDLEVGQLVDVWADRTSQLATKINIRNDKQGYRR